MGKHGIGDLPLGKALQGPVEGARTVEGGKDQRLFAVGEDDVAVEAQGVEFPLQDRQGFRFIAEGSEKVGIHLGPQPAAVRGPVAGRRRGGDVLRWGRAWHALLQGDRDSMLWVAQTFL